MYLSGVLSDAIGRTLLLAAGGFAGGMFAIFVPPVRKAGAPPVSAGMSDPPYDRPLPPQMDAVAAQPAALAIAGFLVVGLSCWLVWPAMSRDMCSSTVADIDRALDRAESEGDSVKRAHQLTEKLYTQCRNGTTGSWSMIQLETDLKKDLKDKKWTRAEQQRFERRLRRDFGITR